MTLKEKTVQGLFWSFADHFAGQLVTFVVGIVLARLLTPEEFGLVGMLTIFIALSQSVVNSGFSQALIRKKDCTPDDYSTVFLFNLVAAAVLYAAMFLGSGAIAAYFEEPQLQPLVKVLGLGVVINALAMVQRTTLTKRIDFRLQTQISLVSSVTAGVLGITLAYLGYGVWSLVWRTVAAYAIAAVLLWMWNRWRPTWRFSGESFRELYGFGSKLFVSGLIDTFFQNIYYVVIGKYFSAQDLGYFTRAQMFKNLPSQNINSVIARVSFPVMASIQDERERLRAGYRRLIMATMLITFVLMLGMAAVAEPLVVSLIGDVWRPAVVYLQLLCFVGMFYPLHALNLNMLNVQGRSDLFLRLEILKRVLTVPTILIGIWYGITAMIWGMIATSVIGYYLNSYWSGRFVGYSMAEQVRDIAPSFGVAALAGLAAYGSGFVLPENELLRLLVQTAVGAAAAWALCEAFRIDAYVYIKDIVQQKLKRKAA